MLDLAVVGAGILGATVAFEARARHPDWALAVVDPAPACGATRWSLGVSFPLAPTTAHRALARDSLAWHTSWRDTHSASRVRADETGAAQACVSATTPWSPLRMLFVVGADRRRAFLATVAGAAFEPAPRALIDEARAAWSLRLRDDDEVLVGDERVFRIDAPALTRQLIAAAAATAIERRVAALTACDDAVNLALDGGASLAARRVVLATGPWYPGGLGRQLGVPGGVAVKRVSALQCELCRTGAPAVCFVDDDLMIVPDDRGERTFVSFYRRAWNEDPDALSGAPSPADIAQGTAALSRRSPSLAAAVVGGRSFCDAYAPERLPLALSAGPNVVAIVGGSGSGVRLAPALADRALRALDASRLVEAM